jgi:hypothetical protein
MVEVTHVLSENELGMIEGDVELRVVFRNVSQGQHGLLNLVQVSQVDDLDDEPRRQDLRPVWTESHVEHVWVFLSNEVNLQNLSIIQPITLLYREQYICTAS